ncbi:uncharacterized protein LOC112567463 [Pomacea canaliculata]|uniref:uncharacterized protein LOC112567463 n=1 Tax=Pomacea canaliculata TaxID=400727 RepID=UPI000D73D199|nr:uncharacterized protein LOC112567463 [Pomacea canaliculata]
MFDVSLIHREVHLLALLTSLYFFAITPWTGGQKHDANVCKLIVTNTTCASHIGSCQCHTNSSEGRVEYIFQKKFQVNDSGEWVFEVWDKDVKTSVYITVQEVSTTTTLGQEATPIPHKHTTTRQTRSTARSDSRTLHSYSVTVASDVTTAPYISGSVPFVTTDFTSQQASSTSPGSTIQKILQTLHNDTFVIISLVNGLVCVIIIVAVILTIARRRRRFRKRREARARVKREFDDILPYEDGNTEIEEHPLPEVSRRKGRSSLLRRAYDAVISVRYERPFHNIITSFHNSHRSSNHHNPYDKQFQDKRVSTSGMSGDDPVIYANTHVDLMASLASGNDSPDGCPPLPKKSSSRSGDQAIYKVPKGTSAVDSSSLSREPKLPPVSALQANRAQANFLKSPADYSSC